MQKKPCDKGGLFCRRVHPYSSDAYSYHSTYGSMFSESGGAGVPRTVQSRRVVHEVMGGSSNPLEVRSPQKDGQGPEWLRQRFRGRGPGTRSPAQFDTWLLKINPCSSFRFAAHQNELPGALAAWVLRCFGSLPARKSCPPSAKPHCQRDSDVARDQSSRSSWAFSKDWHRVVHSNNSVLS